MRDELESIKIMYGDAVKRYQLIDFLEKNGFNFVNLFIKSSDIRMELENTTTESNQAIYKEGIRYALKMLRDFLDKENSLIAIDILKKTLTNKQQEENNV